MPLPVPTRPWESVSLDFITCLPNVEGYDAILTVVYTLTKMAHFIPCTSTVNARQLAKSFPTKLLHTLLHMKRDQHCYFLFDRRIMDPLMTVGNHLLIYVELILLLNT